jgi:hypothetical protein
MIRHERKSASSSGGSSRTAFDGWDARIYTGLQLDAIPPDLRQGLAQALGAVGVEAEYLLRILETFPGPDGPSPEGGELFLAQLDAFGRRLVDGATTLELATQSFLTALWAAGAGGAQQGQQHQTDADPWWPAFAGYALSGEPLELRLRRCGFAYRHVVAVHLSATVEGIAERMALVLHALSTLPPAGTVPVPVLAQGLDELTDTIQGDVVPRGIRDVSGEYLGLLSAIARLRQLQAAEDSSLASDIAWARRQYAEIAGVPQPSPGLLGRIFRRTPSRARGTERWAAQAAQDWRGLIATLEALERGR